MKNKIDENLKLILGEDAFDSIDMQVSESVKKLTKAVNYLVVQLCFLNDDITDQELKEYINNLLYQVNDIIS